MVPAAGSGERLAAGVPKAFFHLDGRTLVERAVSGLLESGVVDRVVVAVPADRTDRAKLILGRRGDRHRRRGQSQRVGGPGVGGRRRRRTTQLRAGARRCPGADTARAGRPRGRSAAGRAFGRRARVAALRHHQGRRRQRGGLGDAGAGRSAGRADPAGVRHRPAAACLPAGRERQISPTTRPWSSTIGGQVQVVDGDPLAFKITTRLDLLLAQAIVQQ